MADPTYRLHVGDTRAVLATMAPGSVDLVLTSPPFLALRSYLPDDDPAKPYEQGSEATPGEFIDSLLEVVEACDRVLAPHGTLAFELGDTYSGSGGAGGDYGDGGLRDGQAAFKGSASRSGWHRLGARADQHDQPPNYRKAGTVADSGTPKGGNGWPTDKSLCLIPEIFRFALVYGFNPLTGRQTSRWRARNVVRWVRPNPPVGALGDKFRPATSDLVIVCKARDRYFDLDAVRVPHNPNNHRPAVGSGPTTPNRRNLGEGVPQDSSCTKGGFSNDGHPAGAPPLDWWKISPKGFVGAHYATWPPELLPLAGPAPRTGLGDGSHDRRLDLRPIRAMCPERVCLTCGEPSRRIVDVARVNGADDSTRCKTDCGHDTWRTGLVLDPYLGSGTTMEVAHGLGRSCVGIDLDRRNVHLVNERMGMWAPEIIDHLAAEATA